MALGAAVNTVVLKEENKRRAILSGACLAAVPDLDMFLVMASDDYQELIIHRSFSHAILPFVLLAFVLVWFNGKFNFFKSTAKPRLFWAFFLVLLTHALLDCLTTWGTQLFWPFDYRIATQTVDVIDLLYSGILFIPLLVVFIFNKKEWAGQLIKGALMLSTLYLGLLFSYQQLFIREKTEIERFTNAIRITTQPGYVSPFHYRTVVEMPDRFFVSRYPETLFGEKKDQYFEIPKNSNYLNQIQRDFDLSALIALTRGYLSVEKESNNVYRLSDLRYAPRYPGSDEYNSIFTYYIIYNGDEIEFRQNMRTNARIEAILRRLFM